MNSAKMKPAAYQVGDRLRYKGKRRQWAVIDGKEIPVIAPGMIVTILVAHKPEKGLGLIKYDEDGEPLIDRDRDGYNVYKNEQGQGHGRESQRCQPLRDSCRERRSQSLRPWSRIWCQA